MLPMKNLNDIPKEFLQIFSEDEFDDDGNLYLNEIELSVRDVSEPMPSLDEFIKEYKNLAA